MSLNHRLALLACAACMAASPGCATEPEGMAATEAAGAATMQPVVEARQGETRLRLGQLLAVGLDSNASTGYAWEIVEDGRPQLEPAPVPAANEPPRLPMPGAGSTSRWRFRAVQAGTTTLRLVYRRSWEKDLPPARTASYRITVE